MGLGWMVVAMVVVERQLEVVVLQLEVVEVLV